MAEAEVEVVRGTEGELREAPEALWVKGGESKEEPGPSA